ncbi:helix-turn-helix transcriptional regulator [Pseudoclavibacter sp. RFBA6]|uniref:helix-turn-helix transcriptional regulator n=1 Tax=Pseudoclavibacter sp. RFBA6 TaxID=2080573 RepID=UPI00215887FB|nr:helix-turn-helix transcriptional regulator [Pseudoclavibacter sp. RFBA6]
MDTSSDTLGSLLRAWRDRLSPADAGITASRTRRASGLRREELADLAGLSVDYVVRLEQGRAHHPSAQVIGALARALHLNDAERDHLYRAAGLLPPAKSHISTHIPPGVQRLIARLGDNPLAAFTADWNLLSWNPLWSALQGDPFVMPTAQRNLARMIFGNVESRQYLRPSVSANGPDQFEAAIVADLRTASSIYPDDPGLRSLIRELRRTSPVFDEHWSRAAVGHHTTDQKAITHPDVGTITLDCDVLTVPGSDLKLVVYSAPTGSPDTGKLDFLRITRGVAVTDAHITA